MSPMIALWAAGMAQAAGCEDPAALIEQSAQATEVLNLGVAREQLTAAEVAFGCAPAPMPASVLARFWLLDGVLQAFNGDEAGATEAFVAARRLDANQDVKAYGDAVAKLWQAPMPTGQKAGTIDVAMPLSKEYKVVTVDGTEATFPVSAAPGLHVVQIGTRERLHYAKVVRVLSETTVGIEHLLPEEPPRAAEPLTLRSELVVALGADIAAGEKVRTMLKGDVLEEPGVKVLVPFEMGGRLRIGRAFTALTANVAPLTSGDFIYTDGNIPGSTPWSWGADVTVGRTLNDFDVGLRVGVRLPSRAGVRAVVHYPVNDMFGFDARLGFNVPTERKIEPAFGFAGTWRLDI